MESWYSTSFNVVIYKARSVAKILGRIRDLFVRYMFLELPDDFSSYTAETLNGF